MLLLSTFSTLGLEFSLIRFLSTAGEKSRDMINTSLTIGLILSVISALIFVIGLEYWSQALIQIRHNLLLLSLFIFSVIITTLNTLGQQIFIAKRRTDLAFTRGIIFGLFRFIPLVILAIFFQTFGILTAWSIALLAALIFSFISINKIEAGICPIPMLKKEVASNMIQFSLLNYFANIISSLPGLIFPIIVINLLGAEQNAYFYMGWSIGVVLFIIPISLSSTLFAEGSHHQDKMNQEIKRSIKLLIYILIPAVILVIVLANRLLFLFGESYSDNATQFLRLLAISALPQGINQIFFSKMRVEMNNRIILTLCIVSATISLSLSWILLPLYGILGIGIAVLSSQTVIALIVIWKILNGNRVLGKNIS